MGQKHGQQHQPEHQEGQQQSAVAARLDGHQQQQASGSNPERTKTTGNDVEASMAQLQFSARPGRLEEGLRCAVRHDERDNQHQVDAPPPPATQPEHRQ